MSVQFNFLYSDCVTPEATGYRITFQIFTGSQTIALSRPLPDLATDMTIDGGNTAGVTVKGTGQFKVFKKVPEARVKLINIKEK